MHPAEKRVVAAVGLHLVFLSWALGGMPPWTQWISLGLSAIGFILALLPRNYTEDQTSGNEFRLIMWPKLFKFPIFWLGAALLGLVATQALNPAWQYQTDGKGWWMTAIPHVGWLPTGVEAPFLKWNQWRMLVFYSAAWLTVCTIWIGLTRRRSVQALLFILAGNGLLIGVFGLAQRLLGNGKIFWFYESPNPSFFSSFIYKNHGGAYLLLGLAVSSGLAGWYYLRGLRRLEKSNPSGVLAFFATCIAVSILTSYARGATITMFAFLLVSVAAFVWHQFHAPSESRKPIVAIALILIFGYFLKNGFEALRSKEAWSRLRQGITRQDGSLDARERATVAAQEMLHDHFLRGTGAGSFRYLFPIYQHRHPELVAQNGRPMFWEHAHNDVLQMPIELGLAGSLLLLTSALYWLVRLGKNFFWENPLSASVVLGAVLVVVYSWWDFPFQNPAILVTWCALWPLATLWSQFGETSGGT